MKSKVIFFNYLKGSFITDMIAVIPYSTLFRPLIFLRYLKLLKYNIYLMYFEDFVIELCKFMNYKQLFLLILTIWSAEIVTRLVFDMMLPPQMEYRTVYLEKDDKKSVFLGASLSQFGRRGWKIASTVPDPSNPDKLIVMMQRQTVLKIGN